MKVRVTWGMYLREQKIYKTRKTYMNHYKVKKSKLQRGRIRNVI